MAGGPSRRTSLVIRFLAAVTDAAARINWRPSLGHRWLELPPAPFQFRRVKGFPYLLIYNADRPTPTVLRVPHMSRDLGPLLVHLTATMEPDDLL